MNYYQIFEINEGSTQDEIKKAYRKLANKYHPDKNQGDIGFENKFKQINLIYLILSDPQKRIIYDTTLVKNETHSFRQTSYKKTTQNSEHKYNKKATTILVKAKSSKSFRLFASYLIICLIYFVGSLFLNSDSKHIDKYNKTEVNDNIDSSLNTGDINFHKSDSIIRPLNQSPKNETEEEIRNNKTGDIKF